jgi:hypothetical protein
LALYSQTISGNGSLIYIFSCVTDIHNNFILLCISPFVQAANSCEQTAELWLLLHIITYIGKGVVAVWCATVENEILAKSFCDHISALKNGRALQKNGIFSYSKAKYRIQSF